jgi:CubicO group peptidase (beta-lactamase class C family)
MRRQLNTPLLPTLLAMVMCHACTPAPVPRPGYPHEQEPIGTVRQSYDGALSPELAVNTFRNIHRLFPSRTIRHGDNVRALPQASRALGAVTFRQGDSTFTLDDYVQRNRVAALLVLKDGGIALERYEFGNTAATRWMSMSVAKSITATLVGAALHDGSIGSLDDSVTRYVPRLMGSAYDGVTIRDVLLMASGVRWNETYTDTASDRRALLEAQLSQVPGSAMALMASLPRTAAPGTRNTYSTGETQVIGEVVRGAVKRPLADYLAERIWGPVGMEADGTWWLDSPEGVEIGGSGISATLRDYARFGQFILEDGVAGGRRLLPEGWSREAGSPKVLRDGTPLAYGYLWWPARSDAGRRNGAFSAVGIHGQFVHIDPVARVVIVVWSAQVHPTADATINDEAVFDAIAAALR